MAKKRVQSVQRSFCGGSLVLIACAVSGAVLIAICTWYYGMTVSREGPLPAGDSTDATTVESKKANANMDELSKLTQAKSPPAIQDNWFSLSSNNVRTIKWVNSTTWETVIARKKPAVIKHKNIVSWRIFDLDLLQLAEDSNLRLNGTRWQPLPLFVLGQERERGGMIGSAKDHPVSYTNITLAQFVASTFDEHNWLYWTGELSSWEQQQNLTSLQPGVYKNGVFKGQYGDWRDFRIREDGLIWGDSPMGDASNNGTDNRTSDNADNHTSNNGGSNGGASSKNTSNAASADSEEANEEEEDDAALWTPMLWLSHPGVVAQTHYDTQHNVFVQVLGSKRFLLFAPGTELYSYPNIHRSYRQSQVHFEHNRSQPVEAGAGASSSGAAASSVVDKFSSVNAKNVTAYEVVLHPGDVLYIPPYWQHRVESLTLSVSLSILSPSYLEATLAAVYWENVPFGAFQNQRGHRTRAVQLYLSLLAQELTEITSNGSLSDLAQQLYAYRFETLNSPHSEFNECFETHDGEDVEGLLATHKNKFHLAAHNVAHMLLRIDAVNPIKIIFLRDYFEQLVRWAVGPDYTASFIYKCLR